MELKLDQLNELAKQVEKELLEMDCSPESADAVAAHIDSTIEHYKIMKVQSIELSTFMAVCLKDLLREVE